MLPAPGERPTPTYTPLFDALTRQTEIRAGLFSRTTCGIGTAWVGRSEYDWLRIGHSVLLVLLVGAVHFCTCWYFFCATCTLERIGHALVACNPNFIEVALILRNAYCSYEIRKLRVLWDTPLSEHWDATAFVDLLCSRMLRNAPCTEHGGHQSALVPQLSCGSRRLK